MKQPEQIEELLDDIDPRIACLINLHIFESLTPLQAEELENWKNENENNRRTFMEATNESVLMEGLDFMNDSHTENQLQKLKGKLHFEQTSKPAGAVILPYWRWVAAASVIFTIGIGTAIYMSFAAGPPDMSPGKTMAILNLPGTNVLLDQANKGFTSLQNSYLITTVNGQLKYSARAGADAESAGINHVISTARAGTYSMVLSDGSKIWLNPSSSISFPPVFSRNERKVTITGEVFFEVAPQLMANGAKKPFIVEVDHKDMRIEVLGTHFNVNAYPEEPSIRTTLVEGSVKVTASGQMTLLKPGQQAEVNNRQIDVIEVGELGAAASKAWKEGNFDFQKADIRTLLREIARWYDMEIEYTNDLPKRHFGGQVSRNTKITEVIKALKLNGIECKIKGRKLVVSLVKS